MDTREFAAMGGDAGISLLQPNVETNELLARVTSHEAGHRMPLEGTPLADNEIEILTDWVAAGAAWPSRKEQTDHVIAAANGNQSAPWWSRHTAAAEAFTARIGYSLHILLAMLIAWLVLRRWRESSLPKWLAMWTRPGVQATLVLAVILGGAIWYSVNLHHELVDARQAIATLQGKPIEPPSTGASLRAFEPYTPPRPHPSVSPTYYRGNDERSAALFNGGFYRTATFHLAICNAQRHSLEIGDSVGQGPLLIRLQIERPPHATETLFSAGIMDSVLLSPAPPMRTVPGLGELVHGLITERESELWVGYYPVEVSPDKKFSSVSGVFYVCRGDVVNDLLQGQLHYQVTYDITLTDAKLAAGSNLAMGSLYKTGNVQVAKPRMIQHNEWFDSRPIPVISGPNTTDRQLLGIDEHLGNR